MDLNEIKDKLLKDQSFENSFTVEFLVKDELLTIDCSQQGQDQTYAGQLNRQTSVSTILKDIALAATINSPPPTLNGLTVEIKHVSITIHSKKRNVVLEIGSSPEKPNVIICLGKTESDIEGQNWGTILGIEVNLPNAIDLSGIPLLGSIISPLEINKISLVIASEPLLPIDRIEKKYPRFLGDNVRPGLTLNASFRIGEKEYTFPILVKNQAPGVYSAAALVSNESQSELDIEIKGVIQVNQRFGSFHFLTLTFELDTQGSLKLIPEIVVDVSGFIIDLYRLIIAIPFNEPETNGITLEGLGVALKTKTLTISGTFLHTEKEAGELYAGKVSISLASQYSLTGLGAYAELNKEGGFGLFIFVLVGFPKIRVTKIVDIKGLAAGLGYNFDLKLPDVGLIQQFPFVAAAMGGDVFGSSRPSAGLAKLDTRIIPKADTYWLAAGIQFTAYKLIEGFGLLTIKWGEDLELALMGIAELKVPKTANNPIVFAQLATQLSFSTATGLMAVRTRLTDASYIFDPNCRIHGGYSFYLWFAGEHAGDFVMTLGGYHPRYSKPSHYPNEERLGFTWQIGSALSLKGGIYFALTPSAIMAGGELSATYRSGGLKAWFTAYANFLLSWKPFRYDIEVGISLGASYTFWALFGYITVSVSLGVRLHLWGPSFGGTATFKIIGISFSISFGADEPTGLPPIPWSEFVDSFLPSQPSNLLSQASNEPLVVSIQVVEGLLEHLSEQDNEDLSEQDNNDGINYIVDPASLVFVTQTNIPAKTAFFENQQLSENWTNDFGVGPCGAGADNFNSAHKIVIESDDPNDRNRFDLEPIITNSPKALWNPNPTEGWQQPNLNSPTSLIQDTLVGFTIKTKPSPGGQQVGPADIYTLQFNTERADAEFEWSVPEIAQDSFAPNGAIEQMQQTLNNCGVKAKRRSLIEALRRQQPEVEVEVDVTQLVKDADDYLLASPVLCSLGH
ncbi:DUF6603 domain-containing protein [Scytonema sp. PCC 10023]|uniref:DUF6603 domain-containing protein n=1 Tax=Scytonema sp. PCC 10023 TaxID=1680591 RepID=UPI0039C5EABA